MKYTAYCQSSLIIRT